MKYTYKNKKFDELLKNKDLVLPDYNHSVLQTITSILKHYNVETKFESNKILDEKLKNNYKNVVMIVLDGLGKYILDDITPNGYFKSHVIDTVTSVYPSTTTAALTTYYAGKPPYETGWIAWSQYFKEYGRCIDMFRHADSYDGVVYKDNVKKDVFETKIKYTPICHRIDEACKDVETYDICHSYSDERAKNFVVSDTVDELVENIKNICNNDTNNFIFAYHDNPDGLMHKYGTNSIEAKEMILDVEKKIEEMMNNIDKDTIVFISADHGHLNIDKEYDINDYDDINEMLIMPAFLEQRCLSFFVKKEYLEEFPKVFNEKFKDEFILLTKEDFMNNGFLGYGEKNIKVDDEIGDFMALSIGKSAIKLSNDFFIGKPKKASTHCGLTKEEMMVDIICLEKKNNIE